MSITSGNFRPSLQDKKSGGKLAVADNVTQATQRSGTTNAQTVRSRLSNRTAVFSQNQD